jgi:hypothetical protein
MLSSRLRLVEQAVVLLILSAFPAIVIWRIDYLPVRIGLGVPAVALFVLAGVHSVRFVRAEWERPDRGRLDETSNQGSPHSDIRSSQMAPEAQQPSAESSPDTEDRHPASTKWTKNHSFSELAAALGVVAAIAYALGRVALARFYGALGVSPEEVGWDLQKTLAGFGVVFLIITAALTLAITSCALAMNGVSHAFGRHGGHTWTSHWQSGLALGIVVSTIVVLIGSVTQPRRLADDVADGRVWDSVLLSILPVPISCVVLTNPKVAGLAEGEPLILLGRTDAVAVLYSPQNGVPLRIQSEELQIVGSDRCLRSKQPWWLF